jgi:hypothetical protein
MGRLADPRRTSEAEAAEIISRVKPMYWATGAIHSSETGSPEMLMELTYRLAVDEGEFIRAIRDNLIVMITPVVSDRRAGQGHRRAHGSPGESRRPQPDPHPLLGQVRLPLERTATGWPLPEPLEGRHRHLPGVPPPGGPRPPRVGLVPLHLHRPGALQRLDRPHGHLGVEPPGPPGGSGHGAFGVPGVYTHDFYDGWTPNYMFWVAHIHNSIGRFYETQASRDASDYILRTNVDRSWHRPNTPSGRWSGPSGTT